MPENFLSVLIFKCQKLYVCVFVYYVSKLAELSVNMRAKGSSSELAFVIDGMYYRSFKPELLTDNETSIATVEGPFDPATAKGLVKNSERNYKIFNK